MNEAFTYTGSSRSTTLVFPTAPQRGLRIKAILSDDDFYTMRTAAYTDEGWEIVEASSGPMLTDAMLGETVSRYAQEDEVQRNEGY